MITLTDKAAQQIKVLQKNPELLGKALRVQAEPGGCCGLQYGMGFDDKKDGDAVIQQNGVVMVLDGDSASLMEGCVIDYLETAEGAGFHIQNPNSCGGGCDSGGCGESHHH